MRPAIFERLEAQFSDLERRIERGDLERLRPEVSAWSVAQQIDHTIKAASAIFGRLPEGKESRTPINLVGRLLLPLGWLPRGVGKAPEPTRGVAASAEDLTASLARAREQLAALRRIPGLLGDRRRLARHPVFGGLTPAQALRSIEVHNRHHLKIVRDIDRA